MARQQPHMGGEGPEHLPPKPKRTRKPKISNSRPARWARAVAAAQDAKAKIEEAKTELEAAFSELNDPCLSGCYPNKELTMPWAPRGFRGRNQIKSNGSLLEAGTHVRVNDAVPGFGEALDRYGVIEKVSIAHYKCYVRAKAYAGWVRVEDLVPVRGER